MPSQPKLPITAGPQSSGDSITINLISPSPLTKPDLSSLITNNSLNVYVDGQKLNSADIKSIPCFLHLRRRRPATADPNYVPPLVISIKTPNYSPASKLVPQNG